MAERGEDYYNHIKEQENLEQEKGVEPNNPTRDQRKMYSETPHGAGALGLSELQGRALYLGGTHQESLQGLQHHHLGVTGHMGENVTM